MNRRHALLASVLLLVPVHAEEVRDLAFATHVNGLPKCDRVDVVRLAHKLFGPDEAEPDPEKLTNDEKKRLYYVGRGRSWFSIAATVTVNGGDAKRLAGLFRAFQQRIIPKGVGVSFCHLPPYRYRFYSGDQLVGEASVCWLCHNLVVGPPGKREAMYFKSELKEVRQLLEASNKLFPGKPAE